ncbi:MAG: NhaP-type Na+/H+ or K+/H+ antiporter [Sphingobacteriales bacterium]|jgi:NhaP-type Na+/H+ or K+/H+ antiporter
MNTFSFIIAASVVVILSYVFNIISKKTSIPSVLMLIATGMIIKQMMVALNIPLKDLMPSLEILGTVGLIMIVLEAALDLKLSKEKWPTIWKSFTVGLLGLVFSSFAAAMVINYFAIHDPMVALVYAIPLSIMSSAIIIPSVGDLEPAKKEFMIYESTFSDILGIMFFYFLVGNLEASSANEVLSDVIINISLTIVLSIIVSYGLILIFQKLTAQVKLFLLIAVLLLLYSIGKLFHLSSLIIILVFGLLLNNHTLFFRGKMRKLINPEALKGTLHDFHLVTMETAFVVRTFFFVIFGITISLGSLVDLQVTIISLLIIAGLYGVRWCVLKLILGKSVTPELYIAPRGLITILLFFAIPDDIKAEGFNSAILLFVIITTSIIMTISLISEGKKKKEEIQETSEEEAEGAIAEIE